MHKLPSPGQIAQWACVAEVSAKKAGNVHPGQGGAFSDCDWESFVVSAMVCRPILDRVAELGVGQAVLAAVKATRDAVGVNTNLGMLLLLAPLCVTVEREALRGVLDGIDGDAMYKAIRLAKPGGLGTVDEGDVHDAGGLGREKDGERAKPQGAGHASGNAGGKAGGNVGGNAGGNVGGVMDAMRLAEARDGIAREYVNGFAGVFDFVARRLVERYDAGEALDRAIVRVHLELMARQPDTLIARKCGQGVADESARRAQKVLDCEAADFDREFVGFDAWLRADGHTRNPGTSADLIAAGLFVAMARGEITMPWRWDDAIEPTYELDDDENADGIAGGYDDDE